MNRYDNVLIPLLIRDHNHIDPKTNVASYFPSGDMYLDNFIRAGFLIPFIEVLGVNALTIALPNGCPLPNFTPNSAALSANDIASNIRGRWGWM